MTHTLHEQIIFELHKVLDDLGATSELLSVTASFGDTQTDEQTLASLKDWRESFAECRPIITRVEHNPAATTIVLRENGHTTVTNCKHSEPTK